MAEKPIFERNQALENFLAEEAEKNKERAISHPRYYNRTNAIECIDEIELVFGPEVTMHFCLGNVMKYRYRAGLKDDGFKDLEKSDWYMRKYKELKEKIEKNKQGSLMVKSPNITATPYSIVPCSTTSTVCN